MPFPDHIPNAQLTLAQVPESGADWNVIHRFAYTFDAYDHFGGTGPVAAIANGRRVGTLTEARSCLFFEHRRKVHSPEAFDGPERQAWVRELIARIRTFVQRGFLDDERIFNRDWTRYVRWQARHRDDLWDHDTSYEIAVFDTATMEQVASYVRTHNTGHSGESGKALSGVRWSEDGRLLLVFLDESVEPLEPPSR